MSRPKPHIALLGSGRVAMAIPDAINRYHLNHHIGRVTAVGRDVNKVRLAMADTTSTFQDIGSSVRYASADYNEDIGPVDIMVITASVRHASSAEIKKDDREELLVPNARKIICGLPDPDNPSEILIDGGIVGYIQRYFARRGNVPHIIVASNPSYALTSLLYYQLLNAGVPVYPQNISGTGSRLDSQRLRYLTADIFGIPLEEIKRVKGAMVIGNHSEEMVPVISELTIDGKSLWEICEQGDVISRSTRPNAKGLAFHSYTEIAKFLALSTREEGRRIAKAVGATVKEPASDICQTIGDIVTSGHFSRDTYDRPYSGCTGVFHSGLKVFAGWPSLITNDGVRPIAERWSNHLGKYETASFTKSAASILTQLLEMYKVIEQEPPRLVKRSAKLLARTRPPEHEQQEEPVPVPKIVPKSANIVVLSKDKNSDIPPPSSIAM